MRPAFGSASRETSFTNVVFPQPVSPTIATCSPASMSSEIVQDTPAFAVPVLNVLGADRERAGRQLDARDRLDDLHGEVEDRQDLPPSGDRGLRLAVDLREISEHVEERVRQEQEGRHLAEREAPLGPEPGAERHDDRDGQRVEDGREREERGRAEVRDDLRLVPAVDRAADPAERLLVESVRSRPLHPSRTRRLREHLAHARPCGVEGGREPGLQ